MIVRLVNRERSTEEIKGADKVLITDSGDIIVRIPGKSLLPQMPKYEKSFGWELFSVESEKE